MTEYTMLDFVPFAGTRWKVTYFDRYVEFVREFLEFVFPQPIARSVAPTAISRNENSSKIRLRVTSPPEMTPPRSYRSHCKLRCIMRDADIDPGFIVADIVDTIGSHLDRFPLVVLFRKVMRLDRDGASFATPRSSWILEFSDDFLLFRVDRERGLPRSLLRLDSAIDMFELGVTVRMLFSLNRLPIRLKAVARVLK